MTFEEIQKYPVGTLIYKRTEHQKYILTFNGEEELEKLKKEYDVVEVIGSCAICEISWDVTYRIEGWIFDGIEWHAAFWDYDDEGDGYWSEYYDNDLEEGKRE